MADEALTAPSWTSRQAWIPAPRRRSDLQARELDGELILFDPATGGSHRLNATARLVWDCCSDGYTIRQIVRRLQDAFDVDADTAQDDVEQLLAALASAGLLEPPTRGFVV